MNITAKEAVTKIVEPAKVTVELTPEEAYFLYHIMSNVSASSGGISDFSHDLFIKLSGVAETDSDFEIVTITQEMRVGSQQYW